MNSLIALTPDGMMRAQADCLGWADTKLAQAKHELVLADQNFNALQRAKLRTQTATTMIRKARARITFYEKIKAALAAGYYIIPPFDVQVFAIRTDRASPPADSNDREWIKDANPRLLPVGEGEYVNPVPIRDCIGTEMVTKRDKTEVEQNIFQNIRWQDIDLPVRAIKPTVIEASGKALALKIFDALGIAPAYRSADPIIVGHIRRPGAPRYAAPLTFFVAWWLDYTDL